FAPLRDSFACLLENEGGGVSNEILSADDCWGSAHAGSQSNRAMRLAAFLEVMLMIVFSAPECWSGFDLRHNWSIEPAAFLQFFFRSVRGGLLLGRMIKNHRSILLSNIRALPVQRSRVMIRPENIQEFVIADL